MGETLFPRTMVGGVSLPRLIVGTNWFRGFSHTSAAQSRFIVEYMTSDKIADVLEVFLRHGVDAIMGMPDEVTVEAVKKAQDRTGRKMIFICTPTFDVSPRCTFGIGAEEAFDRVAAQGATFCLPHQCVTDALADGLTRTIRDIDKYTKMIRDRGMIPGLSTHAPEPLIYADESGADVETYIQIYNAIGFLMHVEADWVMKIIHGAKKPVMTIKPLAAGRILPPVGLAFVWTTLRDQDMVTIGTVSPYEAEEVIEHSLSILERRRPGVPLQRTRSKSSLGDTA